MPAQNIRSLLNALSTHLATIKAKVNIENSTNDYSLNLLMESTVLKIVNLAKGLNFQNANLLKRNFPGIDGIDNHNKLVAQVSSTFTPDKIEYTINKIIEQNLYLKYERLIFIALRDKAKLSNSFKAKMDILINNKFKFDCESDIIDLNDLYRGFHARQDIGNIEKAVNLLAEHLKYIPDDKRSGFDAIGIVFHEEEIEKVKELVDIIIKEGINVYITSSKLYQIFQNANHPHSDLIVLVHSDLSLNIVTYCITVLSNLLITQFCSTHVPYNDFLYNYAIENEIKIEYISFDTYLKEYKTIRNRVKSYRNMQQNLAEGVKKILAERLNSSAFGNISMEEVKQELINTHNIFKETVIRDEADFILLNLKMPGQLDVELNYLILSKDFVLKNITEKLFTERKSNAIRNLNVLVPKDFTQKTRKRLGIVKTELHTEQVEYIDEFLFDKRFGNLTQKSILATNEFVSPVIKNGDEFIRLNDVIHWIFNNSDSSMAIINGSGGIGKTTVCQKISDIIVENNERIIVIFIDADKYIEVFGKKGNNGEPEYDIYNIFNACYPHASHFDKNSFYLNCSLGNIVIIFDGIDEIISTIPSFNLFKFLRTLENLRARLGKEKILINCRDAYINDVVNFYLKQNNSRIQVYELLAFSEELAKTFFSKHYPDDKLVNQCLKLANEIFPINHELIYKYPPFILEIIIQIVSSEFTYEEIDTDFNSKLLLATDRNDIVIYRICNRELVKKEKRGFQLSIDQQIQFLCEVAVEEKGAIHRDDFKLILQQIEIEDRVDEIVKGLIDHPLLLRLDDKYIFRFDFLEKYFKSVAIFNMIGNYSEYRLTDRIINVLAFDCNFNSVISKTITKKAKECEILFSDCLNFTKLLIKKISEFEEMVELATAEKNRKAISNILVIILLSKPDSYKSEDIVNYLFGNENKEVSNFYLVDIPLYANIIFNFSGFYFTNSEFINFGSFFQCQFDSNTFFDETCFISKVFEPKINWAKIAAEVSNFDKNIKGDNSVFKIMNLKKNGNKEISKYFKDYLRAFYKSGQLELECLERAELVTDEMIDISDLRKILMLNEIVIKCENGIVYLNERLKFKIQKFVTQGLPFSQINKCVSSLRKLILSKE